MTPNEHKGAQGKSWCACVCVCVLKALGESVGEGGGVLKALTHTKCVSVRLCNTRGTTLSCYQSPPSFSLSCSHTRKEIKSALAAPGVNKHS